MTRPKKRTRSRSDPEPVLCINCETPTTHDLDQCDDCLLKAVNSPPSHNRYSQAAHPDHSMESDGAVDVVSPDTVPILSAEEEELRFGLDNDTSGDHSDDDIIGSERRSPRQQVQVLVPAHSPPQNHPVRKPASTRITRLKFRQRPGAAEHYQQAPPTLPEDVSLTSASPARNMNQEIAAAAGTASDVANVSTAAPVWGDTSQAKQREQLLKSIMAEDHCKIQELTTENAALVDESAKLRSVVDDSRLENEQLSREVAGLNHQVQGLQAELQSWRDRSNKSNRTIETLQAQLQKYHDAADIIGAIQWGCKHE